MALTSLTNLQPLHVHSVGVSTFDGSVSVGGTLTYEDVTNVDAIGIVTARSGVNVSGGQLDVGSNIKLGNAGVITATSFVGNIVGGVTGNISIPESIVHTGDTNTRIAFIADETISFDTNGSEKLRITGAGSLITSNIGIGTDNRWKIRPNASNQELSFEYSTSPNLADSNIKFRLGSAGQFGIGNAVNYGSSGQVLTSGGASGAPTWSTITGTTINSNVNNYVVTATGTANTLNGESQFTYDGTVVSNIVDEGTTVTTAEFRNTRALYGGGVRIKSNNGYGLIQVVNNSASANASLYNSTGGWHWDNNMQFHGSVSPWTNGNLNLGTSSKKWQHTYTGSINNALHVSSGNNVGINESSPTAMLHVNTSHYVTTSSGKSTTGIHLDGTWGNTGEYGGGISFACGRTGSAAIAARQMTTQGEVIGLSFFTHDSSTASDNAVEKVRIYDGGSTCFNNGIVLGNGLTYDADHLMDDYEEGSYTPVVQTDNGVNCGMAVAQGYFVKVGKLVTVHLKIQTNSHNSVNTAAQYKVSLPYTSMASGDTMGTLMCSIWSIGSSNISWMGGQVHNNNAWTHLAYHNGNNNNTNNLQPNVAGNQLQFRGTVVYRSNT